MQCPNCGKPVRSKTHCARCGYSFTEKKVVREPHQQAEDAFDPNAVMPHDDLHETMEYEAWRNTQELKNFDQEAVSQSLDFQTEDEDEELVPEFKPKRRRGFMRVIFSILQMVAVLILLFLAFLYGPELPKYLPQALNAVGIKWGNQNTETPASSTSSQVAQESSKEEASTATGLQAKDKKVDLSTYPFVTLTLTFERPLENLTRDTFKFSVDGTELTEYSLVKESNNLVLRYVDPSYQITKTAGTKVNVAIKADSLSYNDQVDYQTPDLGLSQDQVKALDTAFKSDSNQILALQEVGSKAPYLSSTKSTEASNLFAWFVLARTYQLIDEKKFELTTEVEIQESLRIGTGETAMSTHAIGSKISIQELIDAVVVSQDATALNYLIQQVGGANELNIWLNSQGYYSTKMSANLGVNDSGDITGVATSAYDLTNLLNQLAQDKLVNEKVSAAIKEAVLKTPVSTKFPADLTTVTRRYEMTTPDQAGSMHHYAAILEMNGKSVIVVVLGATGQGEAGNANVAKIVKTLAEFDLGHARANESSSSSSDSSSTSSSSGPELPTQAELNNPNVEPAPVFDYFDDDGDGVLDSTPRQGRWYWDTTRGTWLYY